MAAGDPCAHCGRPVPKRGKPYENRARRYCSIACRQFANSRKRDRAKGVTCPKCGDHAYRKHPLCRACAKQATPAESARYGPPQRVRVWSKSEEARLAALLQDKTPQEASAALGKTVQQVKDKASKLGIRLNAPGGRPSALEDALASALDRSEIPYRRQVRLGGFYVVDFLLGSQVVEVNGCYWHGCVCRNGNVHRDARRRRSRDKRLDTYCRNRDIQLTVLWEHDFPKCLDMLSTIVQKGALKAEAQG